MQATQGAVFLIVFREALEAGLIIGIILTVLARLRAGRYYPHVLTSVGLAVLASLAAAGALESLASAARGRWEQIIEGVVSLAACAVVTYMVFWMHRQARQLRSDIESAFDKAVPANDVAVMVSLPFIAVFREGAETVLFLKAVSLQSSQAISWKGGVLGLLCAAVVTFFIFVGGRKMPLKPLFQWTGYFLVLISAGLLAYGIHELEEAGWINGVIEHVWNINPILNEKEGIGSFLKALFGYNGNPSLVEVLLYWAYLAVVLFFLHRPASGDRKPPIPRFSNPSSA